MNPKPLDSMKNFFFILLILTFFELLISLPSKLPLLDYRSKDNFQEFENHFYTESLTEKGFEPEKTGWYCQGLMGFLYSSNAKSDVNLGTFKEAPSKNTVLDLTKALCKVPNTVPLFRLKYYVWSYDALFMSTDYAEIEKKLPAPNCYDGYDHTLPGCSVIRKFRSKNNPDFERNITVALKIPECFRRICHSNMFGWQIKIMGCVYSTQYQGTIPVYRKHTEKYANFGGYMFPLNRASGEGLFNDEGIAFYIMRVERHPIKYDTSDATLWKKFREHLVVDLSKLVCDGNIDCEKFKATKFQTISSPMAASWFQNPEKLNEKFCYVPGWKPYFEPKSASSSGQIDRKYVKFLETIQDNQDAKDSITKYQLMRNKIGDNVCFPWEETSTKLKDWMNNVSPSSFFESEFDVAHSFSKKISWSNFDDNNLVGKGFVNYVDANVKLSDDIIITSYLHKVQMVKSSRFDMKFTAEAVKYIEISPSNSWFDKNIIEKYKSQFNSNGFSGSEGKFPILPIGVFVAIKPKVEMSVSKSLFDEMEKYSTYQSWVIGGVTFNKKDYIAKPMTDNKDNLEKIKKEFKSYGNEDFEELDDYLNMVLSDRGSRENVQEVKYENIILQLEGEYEITFETNDPTPQIIGVVSQNL